MGAYPRAAIRCAIQSRSRNLLCFREWSDSHNDFWHQSNEFHVHGPFLACSQWRQGPSDYFLRNRQKRRSWNAHREDSLQKVQKLTDQSWFLLLFSSDEQQYCYLGERGVEKNLWYVQRWLNDWDRGYKRHPLKSEGSLQYNYDNQGRDKNW